MLRMVWLGRTGVQVTHGAGVGQLILHVAIVGEEASVSHHPTRLTLAVLKYYWTGDGRSLWN